MKRTLATLAVLATAALPVAAGADNHAKALEKAIKARQGLFQVYAFNLGQLGAMAKGEAEYDAETAQNAADNLLAAVSMKNGLMWPEGSDNAGIMKGKTRALPEIWTTYPKIAEKSNALKAAAIEMQAAAGSLDGIKGAIGNVGGSCKGCHDDFRAKDF